MKKTLTFFLFFTLVLSIFFVFLPHDTVKAITYYTTTIENFDSYAEGITTGNNGYLTWKGGATSTLSDKSAPLGLKMELGEDIHRYVYLNFTKDISFNGFSYWFNYWGANTDYWITEVYNQTDVCILRYKLITSSTDIFIYDYDDYYKLYDTPTNQVWYKFGFQGNYTDGNPTNYVYYYIENSAGDKLAQLEKRWMSLNSFGNQSISRIRFESYDDMETGEYMSLDDFNLGLQNLGGTPSTGGCSDFSEYYVINHVTTPFTHEQKGFKLLEFISFTTMSAKLNGFEFLVNNYQFGPNGDTDLSKYYLYINGIYAGTPSCYYTYNSISKMMQWDLTLHNITLNDEKAVFDLYHDTTNFVVWDYQANYMSYSAMGPYTPDTYFKYSNDIGYANGKNEAPYNDYGKWIPQWKLYFSEFSNKTCGYINSINIIDTTGQSLPVYPSYNKPFSYMYKTIFFDTYINDLNKYWLNVYRNGQPVGFSQYYPKKLVSCNRQYGFTSLNEGNYTVSLYDENGYYLNKTFYIFNTTTDFAIWTSPNPSLQKTSIIIGVYCKNPSSYKHYAIGYYPALGELNNFLSPNIQKIYFENMTSNYYYVDANLVSGSLIHYFKLFATNGTIYNPITGAYIHFQNALATPTNYIYTSLGDKEQGYVDTPFIIYGLYAGTMSKGLIYLGNEQIGSVSYGAFTIPDITIHKKGTYVLSLKGENGDILASCTIQIDNKITFDNPFDLLSSLGIYKPIAGLIIMLAFILGPVIAFRKNEFLIANGMSVIALMSIIGLSLCIWFGLFELWIAFLIAIVSVGILALKIYQLMGEDKNG